MSWTQVYLELGTGTDQVDAKSNDDESIEERITQTYVAISSEGGFELAYNALSASGPTTPGGGSTLTVPTIGDTVSVSGIDGYWDVVHVLPKRATNCPGRFDIQVELYRKISPSSGSKWSKQLSITSQGYTQDATYDKDGNGIWNSAGDAFDPKIQETFFDEAITYSYRTLSPPNTSGLVGCVNSDSVSISVSGLSRSYTARQIKLTSVEMSTTLTSDGQTPVWDVKMTFDTRTGAGGQFTNIVLDQGKFYRDGGVQSPNLLSSTPPEVTYVGGGGLPVGNRIEITAPFGGAQQAEAYWLDGSGGQAMPSAGPSWLGFKIEPETAFSSLLS